MKRSGLFLKLTALTLVMSFLLVSVCATLSTEQDSVSATTAGAYSLVDGSDLVIKNNTVSNIPTGSKAYYVLDGFEETAYVSDTEGKYVSVNQRLGTGYKITFTASSESLTIIVSGDLDGDTYLTAKDIIRAKKYLSTSSYSFGVEAMDYNFDGKYTKEDLTLMAEYAVSEKTEYPDIELVDVPLAERPVLDIGTDFYANIGLSYADNVIMPVYSSTNSVVSFERNGSAEQVWHFTRNSDGSYTIKNLAYDKVLDLAGLIEPGMDVKIYSPSGSDGQKWNIVYADDGKHYVIYPKGSVNTVLDIEAMSNANYANAALGEFTESMAQKFNITKFNLNTSASYVDMVSKSDLGDVFYSTLSAGGKRVAIRDTNVLLYTVKNQPDEMWKFTRQADGSYVITNMAKPTLSLDVADAKAANATNVQIYKTNKSAAQCWNLYIKNGSVILSSALSNKFVLDIYAGSFTHGANVDIYTFNDSAAQKFTLEKMTADYSPVLPKNKHYDILFIGNSFTWYHSMTNGRFTPICQAAGYDVTVRMIEHGGAYLSDYIGSGKYAAEVNQALATGGYEYVIIQEQSTGALAPRTATFHSSVRTLTNLIRSYGAEVVLYQTWGFHPSNGTASSLGGTVAMESHIRKAYDDIGYEVGAIMAHVGEAFSSVYSAHGLNIDLWLAADKYHPSTLGSTLAAYTIFASIFRVDPRQGIDHNFESNRDTVNILRDAAYRATFE